jgi:ribosomal protein L11 methyltransferase
LNWLEISIVAHGEEQVRALVDLFDAHAHGGAVVETPVDCFEHELVLDPWPNRQLVKGYLPLDPAARRQQEELLDALQGLQQRLPLPEADFRELAEEDWAGAWKRQFQRMQIGRRVVIVPAWEAYSPQAGEAVIRLEPGMAFGTGLHPTTRLCLQALESHLVSNASVLDVGTGSGVLAIAAAQLGACSVLALDADPVAVRVAQGNIESNGVGDRVVVQCGTLPGGETLPGPLAIDGGLNRLQEGLFDLVVINILAPVIAAMAPALGGRLAQGGRLVVAGLIESQEEQVVVALQNAGLQPVERAQEEDWVCLVVRKA